MNLSQQLEAIIFWKAEPVSIKKLVDYTKTDEKTIKIALDDLENQLKERGITLIRTEDEVVLGTNKEFSNLIQEISKEELSKDLGKAALETLSIILYQGPISRTDIDYIRGVNSQFIIRNLLIRGLIERVDNPLDSRSFLYKSSLDLLAHLGLSKLTDLPEYENIRKEIAEFKNTNKPKT